MEDLKINGNELMKCLEESPVGTVIEEKDGKKYIIFNEIEVSGSLEKITVKFFNQKHLLAECSAETMGGNLTLTTPDYLGRLHFNVT